MLVNRNPEYFLMLVQERNFSRAAEKLYISQSSLSQYIAKLESTLEVRLLDRSKSPIELTLAGQVYQRYLESNGYLYQKLQSELNEINSGREQAVNIGMGTWRGSILIPEILPAFLETHPQARVNLHEFPVSELFSLVLNGAVDFAVMNTTIAGFPDALVQDVIAHERILLVMNRDTPEAIEFLARREEKMAIDLNILKNQRFISLNKNLTVGQHVGNFLDRNQLIFPDRLYTTNNSTALHLTAKGLGFCFLVETGLEDTKNRPELVAIDLQSQDLMIPLSLIHKKNSYLSPLVQDAMELIRAYYLKVIRGNAPLPAFRSKAEE